jgi:hypothetical protein
MSLIWIGVVRRVIPAPVRGNVISVRWNGTSEDPFRLKGMLKYISITVLLVILIGCSVHKSSQLPVPIRGLDNLTVYTSNAKADTLLLKPQQTFGSNKDVIIGRMGKIAVDKTGRVFIADEAKRTIDIFRPDGTYQASMGRKGKGPGEFIAIGPIKVGYNGLYVYDVNLQKISIFSLSSLHLLSERSIKSVGGNLGIQFYIKNDSTFLIGFRNFGPPNIKKYIYFYYSGQQGLNQSGRILKKKIRGDYRIHLNGSVFYGPTPGGRTTLIAANHNHIYSAWTEHFLIKVYNSKGKYKHAFYYPYQNVAFNKSDFISKEPQNMQHAIQQKLDFPKTWPALHSMQIDDQNRLWVSTIVRNQKVYQWWVLNKKGKLLARFTWPRDKPIEVIKNGKAYTKETNKKTGVQRIVRYKIQMQ